MTSDALAGRLRDLRQHRWPESLTQRRLGELLGVAAPTISSWESAEAVPPPERLSAYATVFASRRSVEEHRLLGADELTEAERAEFTALHRELTELRARTGSGTPSDDLWHFADGAPVRIICGRLDAPPETASGHRWNYMALSAFADLDALVHLYGHLREHNPGSDVRYKTAGRLEGDDLGAHLVLLGNLAMTQSDLGALVPDLPVHQISTPDVQAGELFEVRATGARFGPRYAGAGEQQRVVEDIGMLARTHSPVDPARTLTLCSGIYTRGVYGAVRCLSDRRASEGNTTYLRTRFPDISRFGILMRVRGSDHAIGTPRLDRPEVRVHEFEAW